MPKSHGHAFGRGRSNMKFKAVTRATTHLVLSLCFFAVQSEAGTWGEGRYGEMVWGATPQGPAPTIEDVFVYRDSIEFLLSYTEPASSGVGEHLGYRAVCTNERNSNDRVVAETKQSTTSLTVLNLTPGASYKCLVSALNDVGPSDFAYEWEEEFKSNLGQIIAAFCRKYPDKCKSATPAGG